MGNDNSERLLALAVKGDTASWAELLSRHVDRLARLIALRMDRRLQGRIDAEDVIQEIYLEAWRHLPRYQSESTLPFYLWLRGLARNKLLELHRRHLGTRMRDARREHRPAAAAASGQTSLVMGEHLLDSCTSPSRVFAREEMRLRIQQALNSMDDIDREVLALRHFEHLSPSETAQVLGVNEKAAGMRYIRAVKRLREQLQSLPGGLSGFRL